MWTRQHKKRRLGVLIVPAIAAVFLAYFWYHAFHGEYGLHSKNVLQERVAALESELGKLRAERAQLERRVQMVQDGSLDRDMLDELARRHLNLALPEEITIMRPVRR